MSFDYPIYYMKYDEFGDLFMISEEDLPKMTSEEYRILIQTEKNSTKDYYIGVISELQRKNDVLRQNELELTNQVQELKAKLNEEDEG